MKRYRLLKDLPFAKAGAIFKEWTGERSGKEEKALLKGTNLKKAIKEAGRIFRENKPEDFKVEDLMVAEKYDRKYDELYQYVVLIEVDILDF